MNNVKYFYVRQPNVNTYMYGDRGDPIACVAYRINHKEDIDMTTESGVEELIAVDFAVSTVKPNSDMFNKSRARQIANGRLLKSKTQVRGVYATSLNSLSLMNDIMYAIAVDRTLPSTVIKAAKAWLKTFTSF